MLETIAEEPRGVRRIGRINEHQRACRYNGSRVPTLKRRKRSSDSILETEPPTKKLMVDVDGSTSHTATSMDFPAMRPAPAKSCLSRNNAHQSAVKFGNNSAAKYDVKETATKMTHIPWSVVQLWKEPLKANKESAVRFCKKEPLNV